MASHNPMSHLNEFVTRPAQANGSRHSDLVAVLVQVLLTTVASVNFERINVPPQHHLH